MSATEPSAPALTSLEQIRCLDGEIVRLNSEIARIRSDRQSIINAEGARVATIQIGQDVEMQYGYARGSTRRYRVVEIRGRLGFREFTAEYYGQQVKKDGTLGKDKKQLYNIKSIHPLEDNQP